MAKSAGSQHDTPAMRQYRRFKEQHPDCVLFFRMGDFYEMFYEDAKLAHKVLGVTLTQRTQGIPMAGVPYHSVEGYLRRMIQAGYRVAVCEQVEDAAQAKGVVERDVARVITPGTLTDENLLDEASENPLAAVVFLDSGTKVNQPTDNARAALAWAELSTGAFHVALVNENEVVDELARISPKELLCCETATGEIPPRAKALAEQVGCPIVGRPAWHFRLAEAREALCKQYAVKQLAGFGFEDENDPTLSPAGGIVHYLLETQRLSEQGRLAHLQPPRRFVRNHCLILGQTTLTSLEVFKTMRTGSTDGSLLGTMQQCTTPMGKRLLRHWLCYPLADREQIEVRQQAVETFVSDDRLLRELHDLLDNVQDIPRILGRLAVNRATPRDMVALGKSSGIVEQLCHLLADIRTLAPYTQALSQCSDTLRPLASQIEQACVEEAPAHMRDGGLIRDGFDAQLDEYRSLQRDSRTWLANYQKELVERTDLSSLKIGYNKVFGYYIELTASQRDKAPDNWVRKQTLKNAERFITDELKQFEVKILSAESKAVAREQVLFDELCTQAQQQVQTLQAFADTVASLDVLSGFARCATQRKYVRPTITDEPILHIRAGRHPVLDQVLGDQFVPNNVTLGTGHVPANQASEDDAKPDQCSQTLALITGPNMAGKSTFIRQAALITLLAHTGSFVPADEAVIGLCDRIFTRIGASDELHAGQSTFMVEMTETANLCHHATPKSLVILDEIGRGTSTLDGLSLAWAITEHLAECKARCLFATHYHELTALADAYDQVVNLNVAVREWKDDIVFLHQIVPGATDRSYGIHVAKIAGLPRDVVQRANGLLRELSVSHSTHHPQAAPAAAATSQMGLFTEYMRHPAIEQLEQVDLDSLTPLQAFDLLRQLREQLQPNENAR